MTLFELDWLGGPTEKMFRRLRPGIDELPWGTLDPRDYDEALVDAARRSWTEGAYSEYRTAAAFAALLEAMLAAAAPIDLIGMASGFVTDEMTHVELNSRMAMELGGGAPYLVDFEAAADWKRDGPALLRMLSLAIEVCCVGEAFSAPMLAGTLRAATHPLTRAVLERIVRDEAPHARLGWLLLDWSRDRLGGEERAQLSMVAREAVDNCARQFRALGKVTDTAQLHALGWMEPSAYREAAERALWNDVVVPLARRGICME
ncbi:MAG TPA: ferritin-like domain-containing protein [Polyangiaceae bacterium]|nr:ferritin-like domain-containing protein [Polyangiaceae bacterium]